MSRFKQTVSVYIPTGITFLMMFAFAGCGNGVKKKADISIKHEVKVEAKEREPGTWNETLLGGGPDGSDIRYTVLVPEGYDGTTPTPLIFTLHFGGKVTPFFGEGILKVLTKPALGELGAIIVAPDSVKGGWSSPENDEAVIKLFDLIAKTYSIDSSKTLVTGYSLGGHGAFYFGAKYPDKFRAALPIAANPSADARNAEWSIPLYVIHSRRDEVVAFGPTEKFAKDLKAKGGDIEFVVLDDLSHYRTPAYVEPLKGAIPWIQKVWGN